MFRFVFLIVASCFPLLLHSQCDLKFDDVRWDSTKVDPRDFKLSFGSENGSDILSPLSKSQNNIEVRIIRLIPSKRFWINSCIQIYCNDGGKWEVAQFVSIPVSSQDSLFSSGPNIKWEKVFSIERTPVRYLKYQIILPDEEEAFWINFWKTFHAHEYLSIKKEEEINEQMLADAIREFGSIDSIPLEHRLNVLPLHGISFRLELKYLDKFKRLEYYAADFYTKIFPDVPEFQKMVKLFQLIDDTFGFLEHR